MSHRVIVTGGSGGIGAAIVERFLTDGARVVVLDRRAPAEESASVFVAVDLLDPIDTRRAVGEAIEVLGGVDVLVNCAAIFPVGGLAVSPVELTVEAIDANALAGIRMIHEVREALEASRAGRVINFTSVVFHGGTPPEMGAYIVSKAAVIGATRALARALE